MRVGINPAKNIVLNYRPAPVTVAVLVYIPHQMGYFSQRFHVLKLCLESIIRNTGEAYDLFVFDNGSCSEVGDYLKVLKENGYIQHLHLCSKNIGKLNALKFIFQSSPGEVVAYCDDDILFYPGWLSAQLEILKNFPRVGMVSGVAVRHTFNIANKSCLKIAQERSDVKLEFRREIPSQWERDWAVETGRDPKEYLEATSGIKDVILNYQGHSAFATANHFQFIAPRLAMLEVLSSLQADRLMGNMAQIDEAVDAAGYLRLSTRQRFVRHMGNIISPVLSEQAKQLGLTVPAGRTPWGLKVSRPMSYKNPLRQLMKLIYDQLFFILNAGHKMKKF